MTKLEAEPAIRRLVHEWRRGHGIDLSAEQPSFSDFKRWLEVEGNSDLLKFRSVMGPLEDAERWFDQELGQTWRN